MRIMLGKKPPKYDARNLRFSSYLGRSALPSVPTSYNWTTGATSRWGMMKNDICGDCTVAAAGHSIVLWTGNINKGKPYMPPDADILKGYVAVTGMEGAAYNTRTGANDNGCVMLDVMNYWRQVGISGHKLKAYMQIQPTAYDYIEASIYIFGVAYVGVALPLTAQAQFVQNKIGEWTVSIRHSHDSAPGSWGGHCIPLVAFNRAARIFRSVTWGQFQDLSYDFWGTYGDECYAPYSTDWLTKSGTNPLGFNDAALTADLNALAA